MRGYNRRELELIRQLNEFHYREAYERRERIINNSIFLFFGIMIIFLISFGLCILMSVKSKEVISKETINTPNTITTSTINEFRDESRPKAITVSTQYAQSNSINSIDLFYKKYQGILDIYSNVLIEQGIIGAETKIILSKKQILESEHNLTPTGISNMINDWINHANKKLITMNRDRRDAEFSLKGVEEKVKAGIKSDGSYDSDFMTDYYMNHNVLKIY